MRPPSLSKLQGQINAWNRKHAIGISVIVTRDDGSTLDTVTESAACILGNHSAVIFVKGISGAYLLSRVKPAAVVAIGGLPGPHGDY